jgi:SAM-dependent methyltransferase
MKNLIKKLIKKLGYEIRKIPKSEQVKATGDLQKIFTYVYEDNVWGGSKGEFYSGPGSDEKVTVPYIDLINKFIKDNSIKSVVDLGCGDFRVGRLIEKSEIDYTGVDIVQNLIDRNNKIYGEENVEFLCINAVEDELPVAELCLIRQVLQHLSNENIKIILEKCKQYKYVIVSEHIPADSNIVPNLDMNSNWDIRLVQNSGVYVDKLPFNFNATVLLEVDPSHEGFSDSYIRTSLIEN